MVHGAAADGYALAALGWWIVGIVLVAATFRYLYGQFRGKVAAGVADLDTHDPYCDVVASRPLRTAAGVTRVTSAIFIGKNRATVKKLALVSMTRAVVPMSINSVSSTSSVYSVQATTFDASSDTASAVTTPTSGVSVDISKPGQLMSQLSSLAQSDPCQLKSVTASIAQQIQDAASSQSGAAADALNKLADRFPAAPRKAAAPARWRPRAVITTTTAAAATGSMPPPTPATPAPSRVGEAARAARARHHLEHRRTDGRPTPRRRPLRRSGASGRRPDGADSRA